VNKTQTRDIGEEREGHYLHLAALREVRSRWVNLLNREADRLPMNKRPWFRITEISDHCAKTAGSVELDIAKRERTVELLRQAILRGEFKDARGRSTVACLHMSPIAPLRFDPESAAEPIFFQQTIAHLWLNRADTERWFKRNALTFPWKAKPQSSTRGRPLKWNWPSANEQLAAEVERNGLFCDQADMLYFARRCVSKPDGDEPDDKSVRDMAEKYRWNKFVQRGK
jgi:hypothetical protein